MTRGAVMGGPLEQWLGEHGVGQDGATDRPGRLRGEVDDQVPQG